MEACERFLCGADFLKQAPAAFEHQEVIVVVGMVSQQMVFFQDFLDQLGMGRRFFPHNKKSRFNPVSVEKCQQRFCGKWIGTVVKGDGYSLLP